MPPKVGALASEDFNFHENDCCTVVSADSGEVYTIKFKEMYPDCSCPDFQKKHWPCKHLLGVISAFPNYSWDHLNSAYTDQACFILDLSVGIDNTVSTENIPIDEDYVRESEHSYAVPAEHDHYTEKGSLNARNKCLDVVKEITNHIYCLDNIDVLDQAFVMLKNTNNLLEKSVPRIGNLPIRQMKRRQKMVRKKKASAATGTIPAKEPSTYAATGTIPAKEPSTSAATGTIPAKEPSTSAAAGTIPAKEPSTYTVLGENNKTPDMDENERGTSKMVSLQSLWL